MKDKLIELCGTYVCEFQNCDKCPHLNVPGACSNYVWDRFADYIIANGVVLPPCRLGDMVRRADGVWTVCGFDCNRGGKWTVKLERWKDQFQDCHEYARAPFYAFGKTVFLVGNPAQASEK